MDGNEQVLPPVTVNNIVCTWYIGCSKLDLHDVSAKAPFLTYDPHRFAAAICHMASPKATCLLFNTGRGVCAGTKSRECAFYAVTQLVSMMQRAGVFFGHVRDFKVRNLVASSRCPFTVDLQKMAVAISSHCTYHAGLFPGLRFKPCVNGNKKQALLIYRNGGTVITGNSSVDECTKLWQATYGIIAKYKTNMPVGAESSADYRVRVKLNDSKDAMLQSKKRCKDDIQKNTEDSIDDQHCDIEREGILHLSEWCRMTTREVIKSASGKRLTDFSIAAMHHRSIKRCKTSISQNSALQIRENGGDRF